MTTSTGPCRSWAALLDISNLLKYLVEFSFVFSWFLFVSVRYGMVWMVFVFVLFLSSLFKFVFVKFCFIWLNFFCWLLMSWDVVTDILADVVADIVTDILAGIVKGISKKETGEVKKKLQLLRCAEFVFDIFDSISAPSCQQNSIDSSKQIQPSLLKRFYSNDAKNSVWVFEWPG